MFAYNDWVLGPPREGDSASRHHRLRAGASTRCSPTNPYNVEFAGHVAFAATSERPISATGNRRSFIGRNGSMARPAALDDDSLTGEFGAGMDPCAALQVRFALDAGETRKIVFLLGEGHSREHALELIRKHAAPEAAVGALDARAGALGPHARRRSRSARRTIRSTR